MPDSIKPTNTIQDVEKNLDLTTSLSTNEDMAELNDYDSVLQAKMRLLNNALDEIGFTTYHLKLFCLNGMGYATDSQLSYVQATVAVFVRKQFNQSFASDSEALFAGMLTGAIVWGFSADIIGRKTAFNTSLLLSSIFSFLAGTMGNWGTYCLFVGLSAAAFGGNLVLDTTVFLEYLPSRYSWCVTFLALWWGVGQTIATLVGWAMLTYSSCDTSADVCEAGENRGWRYTYFVNAAIVFVFSMLRLFVIELQETPKYLVCNGRDKEAVKVLQSMALKYKRTCSLTLEQLQSCGNIHVDVVPTATEHGGFDPDSESEVESRKPQRQIQLQSWFSKIKSHLKLLFQNRKVARSTTLLYLSWLLLGLAYPLYANFLPIYLSNKGANVSASTTSGQYRDNVFPNIAAIGGPIIAGALLYFFPRRLGHRGTMAIGALCSMICFFAYTQVKTRPQNLALSSLVYIFIDTYYGCLYAYTPAVLPSAARATGNALAFGLIRGMSCFVPLIAYFADPKTSVPIWICGAAVGIIGCLSFLYPFEPSMKRVV